MFKQPSRGLCWPLWTLRSIVDSSSNYVSWNCNQTFITEKLNAYSRSSCTRGETLACFKISGRNCFPCCAAAACQLHKNMWRFYCIYTHLIMIPNWRLIHTNTNIMMIQECCGGPFSIYIKASDFPDPELSRAELHNLTYLTFWCWWTALSLSIICVQATTCDPGRATQLSRERSRPAQHLPHHPHTSWHIAASHWQPCTRDVNGTSRNTRRGFSWLKAPTIALSQIY